jgi:hypothetical protein
MFGFGIIRFDFHSIGMPSFCLAASLNSFNKFHARKQNSWESWLDNSVVSGSPQVMKKEEELSRGHSIDLFSTILPPIHYCSKP